MSLFTQTRRFVLLSAVALPAALAAQTPHWVGSWSASQQIPEPQNALPAADFTDATLRETFHLTLSGAQLRVHFSNAFGTDALHITAAHLARPIDNAHAKIDPATDRALTFAGQPDVTIPPGAEYISDPVPFAAAAFSDVSVSFHVDNPPARQTGHPGSRATIFFTHGDLTAAPDLPAAHSVNHWYTVSAIDVTAPAPAFAIIAFGDSITDGHGATDNANVRWSDVLATRLAAAHIPASVLNQGIGGNHMLTDGLGPNALARFDRDVLAQTGARTVILLEGVNDVGALARLPQPQTPAAHAAFVATLLASYEQFLTRTHAANLRVVGATIMPFRGSSYYPNTPAIEADRQAINAWIRTHFDALIDFDKITADPADPTRLLPAYDGGDHLHPSVAGYAAMANAIPLPLLTP